MNKNKKNRILIILVIVLGSLSIWLVVNKSKGTIKEALKDFAIADTGSITKIFLADKNKRTVTLEKIAPGKWTVNSKYSARPDAIRTLLYTMKAMEVKSPVGKKAVDNVVKDLAAGGVKVEVYKGDELIKLYYVGGETPDLLGTYMLLADPETRVNSSVPFVMYIPGFDGFLTTRYFVSEQEWRQQHVFTYYPPDIKNVKVEFPSTPNDGFQINQIRDNKFEVIALSSGSATATLDTLSARQYISYFQNLQYEIIEKLDKHYTDSILKTKPFNIITVTNKKNEQNKVSFYYKKPAEGALDEKGNIAVYDPERVHAVINNGADFVTVQYYVFGKIFQPIGYFSPKSIVKN